jgi:hypothetical protein
VNEAAILYNKMVKEFTNQAIADVAADSSTNVLPSMIYLDEQTDHTQASLAYRHITQTCTCFNSNNNNVSSTEYTNLYLLNFTNRILLF